MRKHWNHVVMLSMFVSAPIAYAQSTAPADASTRGRAPQAQQASNKGALDRIKDYTVERRKEAIEAARTSTDALDRDITRLQEDVQDRWGSLSVDVQAKTRSAMAEVRDRRTKVAEWYGGMQHGSDAAWDEVKAGFVDSYQTLTGAFRRARTEFDAARKQPSTHDAPKDDRR